MGWRLGFPDPRVSQTRMLGSEPTGWDGDFWRSFWTASSATCVPSPLGGMETYFYYFRVFYSFFSSKPTGWDGDLNGSSNSCQILMASSKPTVWDGDLALCRNQNVLRTVLSPPCGMATYVGLLAPRQPSARLSSKPTGWDGDNMFTPHLPNSNRKFQAHRVG